MSFFAAAQISISFFGVFSHLLLLVAFIKDPLKCFRNVGTCLVVNLAISDFLYCCLATLRYTDAESSLHLIFCLRYFVSASVLTIASVSLDRFLMVAHPFKHRFLMKRKVMIVWVAVIWILSLVYLLIILFSKNDVYDIVMQSLVVLVILFTAILYAFTYYKLKKQARRHSELNAEWKPFSSYPTLERKTIPGHNFYHNVHSYRLLLASNNF